MRILGIYEKGSGQKLNMQKTSLFFSNNTSQERKQEILRLLRLIETHRISWAFFLRGQVKGTGFQLHKR